MASIQMMPGRNTVNAISAPMGRWLRRALEAPLDFLFPPRCVSCEQDLAGSGLSLQLCDECVELISVVREPTCPRCAARAPSAKGISLECNHCRNDKLWFQRALALGAYEGLLRDLLMRMKTDRSELVVRTLADLTWQRLGPALCELRVDVVTAVPMHQLRRWQRGTNPPQTLAELLAERLGAPAAGEMLRLNRNISPQIGLSRPGRFRNVVGRMAVRTGYHLADVHVLLVDDILTTGATCSEAARVLRRAGASEVSVLALARTPV